MEINDFVISKNRLVIGQITEIFKANEQAKICVDKKSNIIIPIGMSNILKSSPNIIDLIDKGDLVNGYVIVDNLGDVTPGDDNNNDNNNNSNNTNNNDDNSDSPLFTDEEDKTVAPGEIPQTGQAIIAIVAIVIFAVLGSIVYRKHRNMRDIK